MVVGGIGCCILRENGWMRLVWLADYARAPRWWHRFWPRRRLVGRTAAGADVWLLELPFAPGDERVRRWAGRALRRIERRERGEFRLGMRLALAEVLAAEYPEVLAAGRKLACREFAARLVPGLPDAAEVGVLGLAAPWQGDLVRQLMAAGVRVAVAGPCAAALAEECWRAGVALPVTSARKLLEVCDVVVLLPGREGELAAGRVGQRVIAWREPMVWVPGRFCGEFGFNMFPCGMAAALEHRD